MTLSLQITSGRMFFKRRERAPGGRLRFVGLPLVLGLGLPPRVQRRHQGGKTAALRGCTFFAYSSAKSGFHLRAFWPDALGVPDLAGGSDVEGPPTNAGFRHTNFFMQIKNTIYPKFFYLAQKIYFFDERSAARLVSRHWSIRSRDLADREIAPTSGEKGICDAMKTLRASLWIVAGLCVMFLASPTLQAQNQDSGSTTVATADLSKKLEDLQKQSEALQAQIANLKKKVASAEGAKQSVADARNASSSAQQGNAATPAQGNGSSGSPDPPDPSVADWGPAVSGIYTMPTTKDLGALTGAKFLEGVKVRGWISTYYDFNFNTPNRQVVNEHQGLSVVHGRNTTIEGRTFDIHSNSFSLDLAEIEIEKVPQATSRLGFKFDLAFGDAQDIIADSIAASLGQDSISQFDKIFQHASVSYLAPVGKGLRIDFGKFVTHIGGETIENIKNHNFSHGFFYTYAIPFQDTGFRFHYDWSDKSYTEFYLLNGWNATFDNNNGKTFSVSQGWTPSSKFSLIANWMGGPEQNDNSSNWRHLGDFQVYFNPTPRWKTLTNIDVAWERTPPSLNGQNAKWDGIMEMVRYQVTPRFSPAFRFEWYRDPQGFTTGVPQNLLGYTITLDYKLGNGRWDRVLVRPEWRYDRSTANFFSRNGRFRDTNHQQTVGVAFVYYF